MQPSFALLCSYFAPLIYISGRLGIGSTVLMVSHLETALSLLKLDRRLTDMNHQQYPERLGIVGEINFEVLPTDEYVNNFFEALQSGANFSPTKGQLKDAMKFHLKSKQSDNLPHSTIVDMAFDHQDIDGNSAVSDAPYLNSGKKSDMFGLMRLMEGAFYNSASRFIDTKYDITEVERANNAKKLIDDRLSAFSASSPDSKITEKQKVLESAIRILSKLELQTLGIDINTYAFQYQNNGSGNLGEDFNELIRLANPSNEEKTAKEVQCFIKFLNDKTQEENKLKDLFFESDDNFNAPIPITDMATFNSWLRANPIKEQEIKNHLIEIKNHYYSADKMIARDSKFVAGMEKSMYPKTLALDLMKKGKRYFLSDLLASADHKQGMRSIMAQDKENIFSFAYLTDRENRNWNWMKFLVNNEFNFDDVHLKTLFRDILEANDTAFLDILVKSGTLDLFAYQSNRGITYYQSILNDGSSVMTKFLNDKYTIRCPDAKIRFVPVDEVTSKPSRSYWTAKDDIYCTGPLSNCSRSGMHLRKGMDSLTIAAAKNDFTTFCRLLEANADCESFMSIGAHCFDSHNDFKIAVAKRRRNNTLTSTS